MHSSVIGHIETEIDRALTYRVSPWLLSQPQLSAPYISTISILVQIMLHFTDTDKYFFLAVEINLESNLTPIHISIAFFGEALATDYFRVNMKPMDV